MPRQRKPSLPSKLRAEFDARVKAIAKSRDEQCSRARLIRAEKVQNAVDECNKVMTAAWGAFAERKMEIEKEIYQRADEVHKRAEARKGGKDGDQG
jgi:hypothetical protein